MQSIDYDYIGTITGSLFGIRHVFIKTIHLFFITPQSTLLKILCLSTRQTF